jgi:hypothetical protein
MENGREAVNRFLSRAVFLLPLAALAQAPKASVDLSQFGRGQGRLAVGQMAPNFTSKKRHSSDSVTLSSFRGHKPVALIFGSFT